MCAGRACHFHALGHRVDGDDAPGSEQEGAAARELSHGAAAPDGNRVAILDVQDSATAALEQVEKEHLIIS